MFSAIQSRTASCSPAEILARVRDPATWPQWQPEILSTTGPTPLRPGDVVDGSATMLGFEVHGRATAVEATAARFTEEAVVGVRMVMTYEVRRDGNTTVVTSTLSSELPGGVMGWMLSVFLRRRLRRMQRVAIEHLVAQSEAGAAS